MRLPLDVGCPGYVEEDPRAHLRSSLVVRRLFGSSSVPFFRVSRERRFSSVSGRHPHRLSGVAENIYDTIVVGLGARERGRCYLAK